MVNWSVKSCEGNVYVTGAICFRNLFSVVMILETEIGKES